MNRFADNFDEGIIVTPEHQDEPATQEPISETTEQETE